MLDNLLNILGKDSTQIPEGANVDFTFRHAPQSWMVFVLIAVVATLLYGVWWLYRTENDKCSGLIKSFLAMLRSGIVLLAVLIFLGPAITYSTRKIIKPYVMVLMDNSLSMTIDDRYQEAPRLDSIASATGIDRNSLKDSPPSRAKILDRILSRNENQFIRDLRQRGHVRVMTFSDTVKLRATLGAQKPEDIKKQSADQNVEVEIGDPVPPITPSGKTTNIANAIQKARQIGGDKPIAGIVLLSDGQNNAGRDPGAAASRAGEQNIPIFTSGIGDPAAPINLRVVDLWAPENVFQDNTLVLKASIQATGLKQGDAELTLRRRKVGDSSTEGTGQIIESKNVTLDEGLHSLEMKHTPKQPGKFIYSLELTTQEEELLTSDNSGSTAVSVLDEQVRVLLIAGAPNWSYRMVKNLLLRDKTVDLSCWLQSMSSNMRQAGDTVIDQLPRSRKELLGYDAILMFDPDPVEFGKKWIKEVKNFMDSHGGGVFWMAGPLNTFDFFTSSTTRDIRSVLAVRFADMQSNVLASLGNTIPREWPLNPPAGERDHPVLQISPKVDNPQKLWESLPGVYWSFPASAPKPGGKVLLEHSNPALSSSNHQRPLLVAGQYGSGRSMYMGFQGSWRWRRAGKGYFERFWDQVIRHLTQGRLMKGRSRGRILTNKESYAVGDNVVIRAQLYDSNYQPLERDEVKIKLKAPDSEAVQMRLRKVSNQEGKYEGSVPATKLGLNRLSISLSASDGGDVLISHQFNVKMPNAELSNPRMNKAMLEEIADRSGGEYVELNQLQTVYENIPNRQEATIIHGRPVALWDTSRMLILIVVLLSVEWALRKRFGLM